MTNTHPLVVMTDKLANRNPGTTGYITHVGELEQILGCLSRLTFLLVADDSDPRSNDISVKITLGFSLDRAEVESDRAALESAVAITAQAKTVHVLTEHRGVPAGYNEIKCAGWDCEFLVRTPAEHAEHQTQMLVKAGLVYGGEKALP